MIMREKLAELLKTVQHSGVVYQQSQMDDRKYNAKPIRNLDVADHLIANGVTVQKNGKWEVVHGVLTPGGDPLLRCSICKSRESEHLCGIECRTVWHYCPSCGAKMNDNFKGVEIDQFKNEE